MRINKDKTGVITKAQLEAMTDSSLKNYYDIDWNKVIQECDQTGDGNIDFQEFITACISRKAITNREDIKVAF